MVFDDNPDMTATDVFHFDVAAARITYLLNKKRRGQPATHAPAVRPDPLVKPDQELPALLRRQAE